MKFNDLFSRIFVDKKNRHIFYIPRTKTTYVIPEEDVRRMTILRSRWVIALAVGIFVYFVLLPVPLIAIAAGIITYIIFTYLLYKKYLPAYRTIEDYKIDEFEPPKEKMNARQRLVGGIGYLLIAAMLVFSVFYYEYEQTETILIYGLLVVMIVIGVYNIIEYFKVK